MFLRNEKDIEFMTDVNAAVMEDVNLPAQIILWASILFFVIAFLWAYFAKIDEITRGEGKVVSSSNLQIIQNLEGGILEELLVDEGQIVDKDQLLMIIDDTRFSSSFRESQSNIFSLQAKRARLIAQATNKKIIFSDTLIKNAVDIVNNERLLYKAQLKELEIRKNILKGEIIEQEQSLIQINRRQKQLLNSYLLVKKELDLTIPLAKKGVVSEVEILRLKRTENDLKGELENNELSIPQIEANLESVRKRMEEVTINFQAEAREELNDINSELAGLEESSFALADRLKRTEIRSPLKGTVNKISIRTIGGIIQPGEEIMQIVPLDDSLLIETEIKPSDIGFLKYDLKATIKLTAYDFSIYGGLDGLVVHISPDTIENAKQEEVYLVRLRTNKNYIIKNNKRNYIIPGMRASVDIITGKKTVLDYLLKPIFKAKEAALTER